MNTLDVVVVEDAADEDGEDDRDKVDICWNGI